MLTCPQARAEILTHLESLGWDLSPTTLKVPHATHPNGLDHFDMADGYRLWFKSRAVYVGWTTRLADAHTLSYDLDIRGMMPDEFVEYVQATVERWQRMEQ